MEYTKDSSLFDLYLTKEFSDFKDILFEPNILSDSLDKYTIKDITKHYGIDCNVVINMFNSMKEKRIKNEFEFVRINDDVSYYASLVPNATKTVLIIPGGGFENVCTLTEGFPIAYKFNELGYNAFICRYRIREKAIKDNPILDIVSIYKSIKEKYHINEYAICGFSAGGYLAGAMALKNIGFRNYGLDNPSFVILCYPVVTMGKNTHVGTRSLFLGEHFTDDLVEKYSLEKNVDELYPKTFIWHCKDDDVVNSINSIMFSNELSKKGVKNRLEILDGSIHGLALGVGTVADGWVNRAIEFYEEEE